MAVKLSVLIPTVTPRKSLLSRLLWGLTQQDGDYEILVHAGDDVGMGDKLNRMFTEAQGGHVVCVDDDDYLADDYMAEVLSQLTVDFLGYKILVLDAGIYQGEVEHRADIDGWNGWSPRGVTPKCPIRRDLALQVPFGNEYSADDYWSRQVARLVDTSGYVDRALYTYDVWTSLGTEPSQRPGQWWHQRDVGDWPFDDRKIRWI